VLKLVLRIQMDDLAGWIGVEAKAAIDRQILEWAIDSD
jgi:hypothetical protein